MIAFPNAKINIGLNIIEKRKDDFHTIETVFFPIGLTDILEAVENTGNKGTIFRSTGIKIPGNASENLCLKAYDLVQKDYNIPAVKIHLHKIIPIGAGLGGGSSDAAHFIHLLDTLFSLKISKKKKLDYARKLGSDCSFFIENKPVFAQGRGEKLQSITLSLAGYYLVLVCPPWHVSTRNAYSDVNPQKPVKSLKELIELPPGRWKETIFNQFETTVFRQFPGIEKIKKQLYECGAVYASMSGSGSSVYGIFYSPPVEKKIKMTFRDCFVWQEQLT